MNAEKSRAGVIYRGERATRCGMAGSSVRRSFALPAHEENAPLYKWASNRPLNETALAV